MALVKCPECGKEISSEADVCIHCGFPIKKKQKREDQKVESGVIAYRGRAAYLPLYIISVTLSSIGLICAIILFTIKNVWWSGFFLLGFSLPLFIISIYAFVRIGMNKNNPSDCIVYDAEKDKLILSTLKGERIEINPKDYVTVRYGFSTDLLFHLYYRLPNKKIRKVNLGYCENRDSVRRVLDELAK